MATDLTPDFIRGLTLMVSVRADGETRSSPVAERAWEHFFREACAELGADGEQLASLREAEHVADKKWNVWRAAHDDARKRLLAATPATAIEEIKAAAAVLLDQPGSSFR